MNNLALLVMRIFIGGAMMTHGYGKLINYGAYASQFADPIGVGPELSLMLAIGAEFFCALLVLLGLFTRLASVPVIITMAVAGFIVHAPDPFQKKELALIYFGMYLCILLMGPGHFALGRVLGLRKFWLK